MAVPEVLKSDKPCYVLQIQGDSMIDAGIFDGDWVVIEQTPDKVLLIPANAGMATMAYRPEQIEIQGVLVRQMRSYRSLQAK
jgi:repressor LexA